MSFNQKKNSWQRKTLQEIPEPQSEKDGKSMKRNSILENETQTQVIPETQETDDIPVIPETQVDVIFIDGYFNNDVKWFDITKKK